MKNEKFLREHLRRRNARRLSRIFRLLATGEDVSVEVLYAAMCTDGDRKHYRYKQQHVGSRIATLNNYHFPKFDMDVVIKPGHAPHTYRIYRKGE